MEEDKNLKEIIELSEEEINNNDENVSAVLDLVDLKELRNLIARYKELEEENISLHKEINQRIKLKLKNEKIVDTEFIPKSKVKEIIQENSINICGFWCIPTDDLQELLEES